jgi:hypothetical protein
LRVIVKKKVEILPLIFLDVLKLQTAQFDKVNRIQKACLIRITFRMITNSQARKVLR